MIDRLKSIFKKIGFIEWSVDSDISIEFSLVSDSCIKIRFLSYYENRERPSSPHLTSIALNTINTSKSLSQYIIYPIIREILDVFGISVDRFCNVDIRSINTSNLDMKILFSDPISGDERRIILQDDNIELPEPLSEGALEKAREGTKAYEIEMRQYSKRRAYYSYDISLRGIDDHIAWDYITQGAEELIYFDPASISATSASTHTNIN